MSFSLFFLDPVKESENSCENIGLAPSAWTTKRDNTNLNIVSGKWTTGITLYKNSGTVNTRTSLRLKVDLLS